MPPRILDLLWDEENEVHIARHGVSQDEVEEVCFGNPWIGREMEDRKRPVYGQTEAGRYLFIVLGDREYGVFRPITARDMTLPERRRYQRVRGW